MNKNWTYQTWGVCRSVLGIGMVIGFFLPWLGGCAPKNGFDLLLDVSRTYYGYLDSATEFPDLYDRVGLFLMLIAGVIIFFLGALTATGLFKRTSGISILASLTSSYFAIKILSLLISLKYHNALYDTIAVGLPLLLLCSVSAVLFSLGEYFSNSSISTDTS